MGGKSYTTYSKFDEKVEPVKLLSIEKENNRFLVKINSDIEKYFSNLNRPIKLITICGKPGIGKTTMLNSILAGYCYQHKKESPIIFSSSGGSFNKTRGIDILMKPIKLTDDKNEYLLVDSEGLFGINKCFTNEENEEFNLIYMKLLGLLKYFSSYFIINLRDRMELTDVKNWKQILNYSTNFQSLEKGEFSSTYFEHFSKLSIFKRNTKLITEHDRKSLEDIFGCNNIFSIPDIPEDFRENYNVGSLIESDYFSCLYKIMNKILETKLYDNKKYLPFSLHKFKLFVNLLNNHKDFPEKQNIKLSINFTYIRSCNLFNYYSEKYSNMITKETSDFFKILIVNYIVQKSMTDSDDKQDTLLSNLKCYKNDIENAEKFAEFYLNNQKGSLIKSNIPNFEKFILMNFAIDLSINLSGYIDEKILKILEIDENSIFLYYPKEFNELERGRDLWMTFIILIVFLKKFSIPNFPTLNIFKFNKFFQENLTDKIKIEMIINHLNEVNLTINKIN